MRRRLLSLALIPGAVLIVAAAASAGAPGNWSRVTAPTLSNTNQVGLARTADGALHVVWIRKNGTKQDLVHGRISPAGAVVGGATPVVSGWSALADASVLASPSGLQVLFSGLRSTDTSDPYAGGTVYTATGSAGGGAWTLGPAAAAPSSAYASDVVAGTFGKDGGPVSAWAGTPGTFVHVGVDAATPNVLVQKACCGYQTGLATDSSTGDVVLAWFSNASGGYGVHTRTVAPALGTDRYLPGSSDAARKSAVSPDQQVAATGRIGAPGVYVAYGIGYPTWKALAVWQHPSGKTIRVWNGTVRHYSIAAGPDGRLWAMWADGSLLYASRSNPAATLFGAAVTVKPPAGTDIIWKVQGEGSRGPLDLLVSVTTSGVAYWHTQVPPGLTLVAKRAAKPGQATFTVLDAGDPVKGATVKVGGRAHTTTGNGAVTVTLAPGPHQAVASEAGYTGATAGIVMPKPVK